MAPKLSSSAVTALLLMLLSTAAWPQVEVVLEYQTADGRAPLLHALSRGNSEYVLLDSKEVPVSPAKDEAGDNVILNIEDLLVNAPTEPERNEDGMYVLFPAGSDTAIDLDGDFLLISPVPGEDGQVRMALIDGINPFFPPEPGTLVVGEEAGGPLQMLLDMKEKTNGLNLNNIELDADLGQAASLKEVLENPETLNSLLGAVLERQHGWQFLKDIQFKFVAFEEEGETGLGFTYNFDRALDWKFYAPATADSSATTSGLNYAFQARGDVALDKDVNPKDFLDARLTFNFFRSAGGVGHWGEESQRRFVELATKASEYDTDEEFLNSSEWSEISAMAQSALSTQVYWEFGLDASIESDQTFRERNHTLGAHLALDVKAWKRASFLASVNLIDHPFAMIRLLTGYDRDFAPRGTAIPTILIGYDHVDPQGDTPRSQAGDNSSYERLRAELAFKTPLARTAENEFFVTAGWRYYRELEASNVVSVAGIEDYDFVSVGIESEQGLFVGYASGRQPFDTVDHDFYQVGWKTNF